jgi:hypothetical protein
LRYRRIHHREQLDPNPVLQDLEASTTDGEMNIQIMLHIQWKFIRNSLVARTTQLHNILV